METVKIGQEVVFSKDESLLEEYCISLGNAGKPTVITGIINDSLVLVKSADPNDPIKDFPVAALYGMHVFPIEGCDDEQGN